MTSRGPDAPAAAETSAVPRTNPVATPSRVVDVRVPETLPGSSNGSSNGTANGTPDAAPFVVPNPTRRAFGAGVPKVAQVFDSRANSIGALRLSFALLVIVAHAWPLGLGDAGPLTAFSRGQTDLGALSVAGFFVLSGLLVTRSARRASVGRFSWHRALRILPALWVCLALTAFALGPALWWLRENTLAGYWSADPAPLGYVTGNLLASMQQLGIGDLLSTTPYGHAKDGGSIFNGSLWTLRYEMVCYVVTGVVAAIGVFRRWPAAVLVGTGVVYGMLLLDWAHGDRYGADAPLLPNVLDLPLIGDLGGQPLFTFGLMFLVGACAAVFPDRFPIGHGLGVSALVLALLTMRFGGWDVIGLPAFAYAVLWAAMRLPAALHRIGTRQDISYGVYIYAFPIQQTLALFRVQRLSFALYLALSIGLAMLAGWISWHVVEQPALRFKNARLPRLTRRGGSDGNSDG